MRRVVVTGLGVVSALGVNTGDFWRSCLDGATSVAPVPGHWHDFARYRSTIWSPLPDLDTVLAQSTRVERGQNDPVSLMAARAATEALDHAGFRLELKSKRANTFVVDGLDPSRAGVFMGTGIGGANSFLANHAFHVLAGSRAALDALARDPRVGEDVASEIADVAGRMAHGPRFNPFAVSMLMPNAVSAFLGIRFSLTGPNRAYGVACASGTVAIGRALAAVRSGELEIALAGGSEFLDDHHGGIFQGFDIAGTLVQDCEDPSTANRPFDERRTGFLFSQGAAAVLIVEEREHAMARGAVPVAELLGHAETFDANSMMSMEPSGGQIERMIRLALHDARLVAQDIDYVNAHGTGTRLNDEIEAAVIEKVFGRRVPVNATKSLLGHTVGASGALEAVVAALSIRDGVIHPCRNLERPVAPLNFVRDGPLRVGVDRALSQSFAFGGHNAAVVLGRA